MNNNGNQIEFLDVLAIASFFAQLDNMSQDDQQTKYIHGVIRTIETEIKKLHEENDTIMKQNEEIIRLLKEVNKDV